MEQHRAAIRNAPVTRKASAAHPAIALGHTHRGFVGLIESVHVAGAHHGLAADEMERRLLELGFVEGAPVEVLHEGAIGRDPIAVRVHGTTVALRRREAMAIHVRSVAAP
jgi:ferrous iron transport protein A